MVAIWVGDGKGGLAQIINLAYLKLMMQRDRKSLILGMEHYFYLKVLSNGLFAKNNVFYSV